MCGMRDDWGFGPGFPFGPGRAWAGMWTAGGPGRGGRRRSQFFESGEVKFVILRLLKEKPRHGYEVIRALEEKFGGAYTPSAGRCRSAGSRTAGTRTARTRPGA